MANSKKQFQEFNQTMRIKSSKNTPRIKEDNAVNQALYMARKFKDGREYNETVSQILERSEINKKVTATEEAPRFSGKHAFGFTFGQYENIKAEIEKELSQKPSVRRRKALNKQLRDINSKLAMVKRIEDLSK